jgi:hypothetical protein
LPIDNLLSEIEFFLDGITITAIKIDVEGMEPLVLQGAKEILKKYKPDLFIEITSDKQMDSILSILKPIGYRAIVSWAVTPVWHFVNNDKLNVTKLLMLYSYTFVHKSIKRMRNFISKLWV